MKTRLLSAAVIAFAASAASATNYTSAASGNWTDPNTWGLMSGYPVAGDTVVIANGHTVEVTGQQEVLSLTVQNGGVLEIDGSGSPYASVKFPSSGSPVFSIAGSNAVVLTDNAEIIFQQSMSIQDGGSSASLQGLDGDTCKLLINGVSAAATLTNNVLIHGALQVQGTLGGNAEGFANNGTVIADIPGETMLIGANLTTVTDDGSTCGTSAAWQANGATGSGPYTRARLAFNSPANSLSYFYASQGELYFDRVAVSATGKQLTGSPVGIVTTVAGGSFTASDCP